MHASQTLSGLFDSILDAHPEGETITMQAIVDHLGQRAYGPLLMLFAAPNVIPNIPGSGIFSAPLLPLSYQMAKGNPPWLPPRLSRKAVSRAGLERLRDRVKPWLVRADKAVRPRWSWLTTPAAERILGAYLMVLCFVLFLPIPLGNMFPAWSVASIGVGVLERDGVWIAGGIIGGLVALMIAGTVVVAGASLLLGAVV